MREFNDGVQGMVDSPKVSIIILNWNGLKDTIECLESLKKITYPNYEVVVVDNGSAGDDVKILREKFGNYIHIIENDKNYGYTGGNNIGMRFCLANSQPDYLLILNNDIVGDPGFLTELIKVAQAEPSIVIVGPKVYYYDFPNRIQSAGCRINMWSGQVSLIGTKQIDDGQYNELREVDYVHGCCLLIKRDVISRIGLFDESYFCYWDETDYCTRAREAGYKLVYVPEAKVWHKVPMKEKLWDRTPTIGKAAGLLYYYMARNNFKFMRKHTTKPQYISFLIYFFCYYVWLTSGICLLYHRDIRKLAGFYRGVRDGLLNSEAGAKFYTG